MATQPGRTAPNRPTSLRRSSSPRYLTVLALAAAAAIVNLALPYAAQSQISSKVITAPKFSGDTPHVTQARLPKAPVQVAMPEPPATKIVPGMDEVLVAMGPVNAEESKDLDAALKEFYDAPAKVGMGGDFADYARPLLAFIAAHPKSNWNAALHTNMGLGFYHSAYFDRAFTEFDQAWQLGRNANAPMAHLLIDRALGELAKMHARVGQEKELLALFKDVGTRPVGGPGVQLLQGAREGLWNFRHNQGIAYLCGPQALKNVLVTLKASPKQIEIANEALSGPHGYTLPQLAALATKAGLKYTLIHREPGQPVPVPSIINWNIHHYAAIVAGGNGIYTIHDPTFGVDGGVAATQKAIDAESSGYFLVPSSVAAKYPNTGWRTVSAASTEAKAVYGMGSTSGPMPNQTNGCNGSSDNSDAGTGQAPNQPIQVAMTTACATFSTVNLHLEDTPVGYKPQVGSTSQFTTVSYNSREAEQPATFGFSNLSANWTMNWMQYVIDNPTVPADWIMRVPGGGGGINYLPGITNANPYLAFIPEPPNASQMFRSPLNGYMPAAYYFRNLPDGSVHHYTLSNGATTNPRLMFLTSIVDAQGNTTTFNYDTTFRITSIVDPMGRSTTFTYGLTLYPLLITQISDAFGRTTQITYDASARLSTITDPVGITSTFTYSTTEPTFVNSLTTPYGTSTFSDGINPNDTPEPSWGTRSLTLTDPLGYTDFAYFYQNTALIPATDPSGTVPTGVSTTNNFLNWRNTYYWNRHQWGACVTAGGCSISSGVPQSEDVTKANILHFTHASYYGLAYDALESTKKPLENRIWFNYSGAPNSTTSGSRDRTSGQGRVLDDGTSQAPVATYNGFGHPLTVTDALGRETKYNYAANVIDLLTVQQKTTATVFTTIGTFGSYNTQHEPQTYTGADGQTWHYTWNTVGQLKTVTDPNSGVTTLNYDTTGRLSTIVNANSQTVLTNTYDSADRIQTQTDSEGYTLTYAYDNDDRITSITYPDSTTDLYDYNFQSGPYVGTPSLELRKHTDRLGRVTTYAYDADRRLTSVTEPTSGTSTRTTGYSYYEDGTLKEITDANGNVTHWDIDIESRPIDKIYAYGTASAQTETYTYESTTSRLKSITDALGQVKTFTYAKDNRITGITYTSSVNTTPNVTFAWDTYFPRMTSMVDGLGTTSYAYTAIGTNGALKLSSIDGPYTNDVIGLTYDALNRLSGRNITGGNETFGYDAISRLTSHGTPLGSFTEGYLGQTEQMTSQSVTNGTVTVSTGMSYDTNTNDRRLIGITNSGVSRSYTIGYGSGPVNVYDIQSITDTAATGHPWATQSHAYTNDMIDRLLTATATTPGNFAYGYDKLDNATTVTTPSGTVTPAPSFNGLNQISTWGSNTYSFDANGNTLSGDGTKTYKWDAENHLIEIDYTAGGSSKFSYDGFGHRMADVETASGGGTTTARYLWCPERKNLNNSGLSGADAWADGASGSDLIPDGLSQAAGGTMCQTRDGSDTVLKRDLWEGEYNVSTGQKLVYMTDQLRSVRDVLDGTTGNLVQSYDYAPYGNVARSNGSTSTDFQYAGMYYHAPSGLNLTTYRPFDNLVGRWPTRDPIGFAGGDNLYTYGPNVINEIDPEGLADECTQGPVSCGRGHGERGATGGSSGQNTDNKYKKCWTDPTNPKFIICKDHQTGQKIRKPKPADFPPNKMVGPGSTIIVVGGSGYAIYRCIRMIPSLVPPLWWTLPENAIAP